VPTETTAPGGQTNAYLVDGPDDATLIDPAGRTDRLDAAVAAHDVAHVAVTHAHPDHVGGVAAYADATGATVWARRGREARFAAAIGRRPDRTFAEGDDVGGLTVLDTPGHAPDHVAFETRDGVALVCGDLVLATGSLAVTAPEGDLRAYFVALRRLLARDPARLFPGHGSVVRSPRAVVERLYFHRLDRERRIERAVAEGADSVAAVVDAAYDRDLGDRRPLAAATVRAHLEKLAVEGRVRYRSGADRVSPA
jgi:glyoxylase-like metal-dependent hydrolase (beta-lactamase superfamily II)